jgi:two-component system phosphate regulon sensor histidine kinase PhoR
MEWILPIALVLALATLHVHWRRRYARMEQALDLQRRQSDTWHTQYQEAETHNLARQEALFNSMIEGVLVLDVNQRVQLVNQALRQLFNLSGNIYGRTTMEAFRQHELTALVQRAASQTAGTGIELELPGPPARSLHTDATVFRNAQGQTQGTILVFHDLTRLKQLENLRQEFVANVSHELRTPLSMIKGCVETLIEGAKEDPVALARFLQMMQRHTNRLTYLIEDLLTLSQLESGRMEFHFQSVELRALADRVLEDLRARAKERNVGLRNQVPDGLNVRADADRLQQVFYNLVENAIKYGRRDGLVEVGGNPAQESMAEVWVRDNGPGLTAEAVHRAFERFYRADRARSREQGGTGLGLAIVKHLVQAHGGKVWVKSEPGQGAVFYFTVPLAQ